MIFTNSDGGARGNPGPAAIGVTVRDEEKILEEDSKNFRKTNYKQYRRIQGINKGFGTCIKTHSGGNYLHTGFRACCKTTSWGI